MILLSNATFNRIDKVSSLSLFHYSLFFSLKVLEAFSEARNMVYGLRVEVSWLRQVDSLPKSKVSFIESYCPIEASILYFVVGARHPALIPGFLLRKHP